jgi:hypothetical protein
MQQTKTETMGLDLRELARAARQLGEVELGLVCNTCNARARSVPLGQVQPRADVH